MKVSAMISAVIAMLGLLGVIVCFIWKYFDSMVDISNTSFIMFIIFAVGMLWSGINFIVMGTKVCEKHS